MAIGAANSLGTGSGTNLLPQDRGHRVANDGDPDRRNGFGNVAIQPLAPAVVVCGPGQPQT